MNRFFTQTGAARFSGTPRAGGLAQMVEELRPRRFGSALILEGTPAHRIQLAQALASHWGYRVNLGGVVSKYIGETEKNLDALFAECNHPGSMLFFDEADALFGSRTEVKDSHDRYANLARRLLSFQGLLALGVETRYSVPTHLLPGCVIIPVSKHWPPR